MQYKVRIWGLYSLKNTQYLSEVGEKKKLKKKADNLIFALR